MDPHRTDDSIQTNAHTQAGAPASAEGFEQLSFARSEGRVNGPVEEHLATVITAFKSLKSSGLDPEKVLGGVANAESLHALPSREECLEALRHFQRFSLQLGLARESDLESWYVLCWTPAKGAPTLDELRATLGVGFPGARYLANQSQGPTSVGHERREALWRQWCVDAMRAFSAHCERFGGQNSAENYTRWIRRKPIDLHLRMPTVPIIQGFLGTSWERAREAARPGPPALQRRLDSLMKTIRQLEEQGTDVHSLRYVPTDASEGSVAFERCLEIEAGTRGEMEDVRDVRFRDRTAPPSWES